MTLQLDKDQTPQADDLVSPYPLFNLTLAIAGSRSPDDIYSAALACLRDSLAVDKASILLFDPDTVMRFKAWLNLSPEYRAAVEGHTPWTPETKNPEPVLVPDVREEPSLEHLCPAIEAEGIQALAFFPLYIDHQLLGKFMLYYPEPHVLTRNEVLIAQTIAAHVAFALDRHGIRQEQREWREHLEAMFTSSVVGIAEIDTEGRYKLVNDRFCEIAGRSREELLDGGITAFDITHEDDRAQSLSGLASLATGDGHATLEKRYVRPNGEAVWVSNSISALHDDAGNFSGAIAVITDMTQRRIGEQRRRDSEARLASELAATQQLQEASSKLIREDDVSTVFETILDAAVAIMDSDFASLQMLVPERGANGELQLLGHRGFSQENAEHWHWVGVQSGTTCGEVLRTGVRYLATDLRTDAITSDGERAVFAEAGILSCQSTPLISRGGKLIGMISTHWAVPHEPSQRDLRLFDVLARQAADLIDRSQSQIQLAEQNQLMQSITDNMSVGLVLLDINGCVELMNPAAETITGYQLDDAKGRVWHDLVHDRHLDGSPFPRTECVIDVAAQTMQPLEGHETVFIRPDGTFYNVVCNLAPVVSEGVWLGSVLDVRDATVEKQAEMSLRESEEQLRAAAQLKDEFLGLVSHELRTPISTILGNGLLLSRHWAAIQQEDRQQALTDIASEAEKLQEIIENLLLITRLEAGHLESEPLAIERLVSDAIRDFQRFRPERELRFESQVALPTAMGEPTLVPLIMRNLLSNADKYSPAGNPIDVSLAYDADSNCLEVAVRDYGIGLDTAELDTVFEPFSRSKRSQKYAKGMGLGLAVCRRVTEAQGGRIWVEQPSDAGARFVFQLRAVPQLDISE